MDDDSEPVGDQEQAEGWRDGNEAASGTDDPARTPGMAEGVEQPERQGNEDA